MEEVTKTDPPAPPVLETCGGCDGVGYLITGQLDDDLITKLNDMEDKINDIFEKVNE
jgi:hypothetical protein